MSDKPEVSIYPDPPFNSNRNYAAPIDSEDAAAAFKDTWMLLAHLNYFARIYSASPLFTCAFTRLVQRMSAHRRMNKGTHTMRLLPSLTFLLVVLLFSACGPRNASVEPPRSTNTPVPTFTSTPAGSTVSETTGESDTQIQVPPTDTPVPSTPIPPTATPTPRPMVKINNDMNVRQGPGTNFPIIGTASPGQQYPITGKNHAGDWWEINYNGQAGWVFGQLVSPTNAEHVRLATQPTSTPRPRPTHTPRATSAVDSLHCIGGKLIVFPPGGLVVGAASTPAIDLASLGIIKEIHLTSDVIADNHCDFSWEDNLLFLFAGDRITVLTEITPASGVSLEQAISVTDRVFSSPGIYKFGILVHDPEYPDIPDIFMFLAGFDLYRSEIRSGTIYLSLSLVLYSDVEIEIVNLSR